MEIGSVNSGLYSAVAANANSNSQPRPRQMEAQNRQSPVETAAQPPQPQRADMAQTVQAIDESESATSARNETENKRPVVNASGQLVGQRVNTTA